MTNNILTTGLAMGLAAASLVLPGCSDGRYYGRTSLSWSSYPTYRHYWYDGHYGSIYDGYWGGDGFFYYRSAPSGRYYRGSREHFRQGGRQPGPTFRRHDNGRRHGDVAGRGRGHGRDRN